ncbi:hypothetical protein Tco_1220028 [Tanacetum coccineum]
MSPLARASHAKFHWGTAFATARKRFTDPETKLRIKHTNYGFVDHPELQRNEFASHRLPQREGNINGWLIKDEDEPLEHEASDKEVDLDLEFTANIQARGREAAVGANHASYTDRFHELAMLVSHLVTLESSRIKRAGILTDEAVSCGTLTKGNEKRKGMEESSKHGSERNDDKRAKVSKGFVAATTHKMSITGSFQTPGQVGNRLTNEGNRKRNNRNQVKGRAFKHLHDTPPSSHSILQLPPWIHFLAKNQATSPLGDSFPSRHNKGQTTHQG